MAVPFHSPQLAEHAFCQAGEHLEVEEGSAPSNHPGAKTVFVERYFVEDRHHRISVAYDVYFVCTLSLGMLFITRWATSAWSTRSTSHA